MGRHTAGRPGWRVAVAMMLVIASALASVSWAQDNEEEQLSLIAETPEAGFE